MKLLTIGLTGEFLIISRKGCLIANNKKIKIFDLNKNERFKGTLISVRIPFIKGEVDIYGFIE